MKRLLLLVTSIAIAAAVAQAVKHQAQAPTPKPSVAKGLVFHDVNNNKKFDDGDKPLAGVRVSNGVDIVKTDASGRYELPIDDDTIVFVIKPRGWQTPLSDTLLPQFYYIHKPKGSPTTLKYAGVKPTGPLPKSVDFPLYAQQEPDHFKAILFGDPQPRDQKEIDYIAHDVLEELIGTDASFGVTLGDIMFDNLDLFESNNRNIALLGIPWYNVIGNHDINYKATSDKYSDETFERVFGPAYYSFDYGPVHFVVLDDINWIYSPETKKGRYEGGFGPEQVQFLKNDMALIPADQMVVLLMHIPLHETKDKLDIFRQIEQRPFCISISGHRHHHEHKFITRADGWMGPKPHHHIVNVTVSGSWWSGVPDERGIPHTMMADGGPNGYSIISFDGTKYQLDYKASGRPADYQMNIHVPEVVSVSEVETTDVFVNVFNGSERSKVEYQIDGGRWQTMTQRAMVDPVFKAVVDFEATVPNKPWRNLPKPKNSTHLWHSLLKGKLKPGSHLLTVRTTDFSGQVFNARKIIRVAADAPKPVEKPTP
ncbi:MAG: calcineurin-like phosphoesterase family protein [Planctomycetota bacterium]|nr:calcineurin-like phosphoesterase family protein [Planctomycetota bacterium]